MVIQKFRERSMIKRVILSIIIVFYLFSCGDGESEKQVSANDQDRYGDHVSEDEYKIDAGMNSDIVRENIVDEDAVTDEESDRDRIPDDEPLLHPSKLTSVWANNGQDKVTKDELRASSDANSVPNSVWDGEKITLFGAKNETLAFNLILEAMSENVENIKVEVSTLRGPGGSLISTQPVDCSDISGDECLKLFNYTGRNIELFYVRYLQIKGVSRMAYDSSYYDERHAPKRFQRPIGDYFTGVGTWSDRPDHDKFYPDIAVPLELHTPFSISEGMNQSIWSDIYIPKESLSGLYTGTVNIFEHGRQTMQIPLEIRVRDFELPDTPTSKTMVVYGRSDISKRFTGNAHPNNGTEEYQKSRRVIDKFFQMAHRHKISLISGNTPIASMEERWVDKLSGELFTKQNGYEGVGEGTGNNVFSIGTYSSWRRDWDEESRDEMWQNTDAWVDWFTEKNFETETEYFLYLIDESDNYEQIENWATWINENPGTGKDLLSFATLRLKNAYTETPSLDIVSTSPAKIAPTQQMQSDYDTQIEHYLDSPDKRFYFYNGRRPWTGTFATEDDGVALRVTAWSQYKFNVDRWFFWESTYYNDFQSGSGETNVFQSARTFGGDTEFNDDGAARGRTGWNYSNGDGVLFYPGRDMVFPEESYDLDGPIASLRLKLWRRGIQDADYIALAERVDPVRTNEIIEEMIPKVFWEYGAGDRSSPDDPTWVSTDLSWSIDPDVWEKARKELADIIENG